MASVPYQKKERKGWAGRVFYTTIRTPVPGTNKKRNKAICLGTDKKSEALIKVGEYIKLEKTGAISFAKISISESLKEYDKYQVRRWTNRYRNNQANLLKRFFETTNCFFLVEIKAKHFESYEDLRREKGLSEWTLWHDIKAIKTFFNWCTEVKEWLPKNPLAKIKKRKPEGGRLNYLSKEEVQRLLSTMPENDLKYMFAIAVFTGIRSSELLKLCWEDFDFVRNELYVLRGKSGQHDYVPFNPVLKDILSPFIKKSGKVFKYKNFEHRWLKQNWEKALIKVNIKLEKGDRWHILRHTYASHLAMEGTPIAVISKLLGHKNIETTMIYSHLSDKVVEAAGRSVSY